MLGRSGSYSGIKERMHTRDPERGEVLTTLAIICTEGTGRRKVEKVARW